MSDWLSDHYWVEDFGVTEEDLNRAARKIRDTKQAYDLTALARRVVRGRLCHGPEESREVQAALKSDDSVRLWDAENEWKVGDQVIVQALDKRDGEWTRAPFIGEVVNVLPSQNKVQIRVDAKGRVITYSTKPDPAQGESYERWRRKLQDLIAPLRGTGDIETEVDYVLFQHERVSSRMMNALKADARFVRLAGRWFLRELAVPPSDAQLEALAWAMVPFEEARSTAELVSLVEPRLTEGDPSLFGLYLAMRDSDLFENADPGKLPRWVLASVPPGTCTPQHSAYDPDSYEVLCVTDEPVSSEGVERLWATGLLRAVLEPS